MRITDILSSSTFLSAWWLFLGILAGALIQHALNRLTARRSAKNALEVLKVEAEMNLEEVELFMTHLRRLRDKISAGQLQDHDFFFPMFNFNYAAYLPLVNNGYFHAMLGPKLSRIYLEFNRFFNVQYGQQLAALLRTEHEAGRSLAFLDYVEQRGRLLTSNYSMLMKAVLPLTSYKVVVRQASA